MAAKIMRAHAEQNARVERPVYHFALSLAEGERLTREQWNAAVDRVLDRMGLAGHQALVVAHGDTAKEHVHVVVNRVGEDYRAWNTRRDMVKANEVTHELEREHGLRATGGRDHAAPELSTPAYQEALRTGRQPLADRVREEAGLSLGRATSWRDLEERLAARGFRLERAERGSGLVVSDGERKSLDLRQRGSRESGDRTSGKGVDGMPGTVARGIDATEVPTCSPISSPAVGPEGLVMPGATSVTNVQRDLVPAPAKGVRIPSIWARVVIRGGCGAARLLRRQDHIRSARVRITGIITRLIVRVWRPRIRGWDSGQHETSSGADDSEHTD